MTRQDQSAKSRFPFQESGFSLGGAIFNRGFNQRLKISAPEEIATPKGFQQKAVTSREKCHGFC
jgi:hypothetical protein